MKNTLLIRKLTAADDDKIAAVIKAVLAEYHFASGSSAEDRELDSLSHYYAQQQGAYYVVADLDGNIYGGGGFAKLPGSASIDSICEIQKFYFLKTIRAQGYGTKLLSIVLHEATVYGYKLAYLETAQQLESSIKLYQKFGFKKTKALGNTRHQKVCDVYLKLVLA
jgi:putative acetyltransferase